MTPNTESDNAFARAQASVGLFQITEALLGHHFPASRDALTEEVGAEEVILVEGTTATMADVLRQLPNITYDTPQDVVAWVENRWPAVLRVGNPVSP